MTLRFGVIPTNGRDCVDHAVSTLLHQVNYLLVIEAGTYVTHREYPEGVHTLSDEGSVNISRWWNLGLDWCQAVATALEEDTWDVAIINDDVEVPPSWLCYIADDMRALGCVAACSGGTRGGPIIHRTPGPVAVMQRLQGFAFCLAGESGIRADEQYRWYFSDDKLGCIAASMGGVVMYPECHVTHRHPNMQVSHEMQIMITEDALKFKEEWGSLPA